MEKVLCIDIGNTNTKFALFSSGGMDFIGTLSSDKRATAEEWTARMSLLFAHFCRDGEARPIGAMISSVVPQITNNISNAVQHIFGVDPRCVPTNAGVGADVYCSVAYAEKHYALPVAVFSLGTATTAYVLDENKKFLGGMIIPGVITSLNALSKQAANLPQIHPAEPEETLPSSTVGAMNSGIVYGTAAMLDGLAERFIEESDVKALVMCGGMSELISKYTKKSFTIDKDIVLKGAFELYGREEK